MNRVKYIFVGAVTLLALSVCNAETGTFKADLVSVESDLTAPISELMYLEDRSFESLISELPEGSVIDLSKVLVLTPKNLTRKGSVRVQMSEEIGISKCSFIGQSNVNDGVTIPMKLTVKKVGSYDFASLGLENAGFKGALSTDVTFVELGDNVHLTCQTVTQTLPQIRALGIPYKTTYYVKNITLP